MGELKSSEKGDQRGEKEEVKSTSTESVQENPITVDQLSNEEMAKMLGEIRAELEAVKARGAVEYDEEEYSVIDDYLEVPAVFFCFSQQFNIHADKRLNRESLPPHGFVKFTPLYRYYRKNERGVDVISVSQCTTRSKEQAEWLREHSQFNIKFFENIGDVESVDTTLAEKMAEQSSRVSRMSDLQVIEKCKALNMPVHADLVKLRKELIQFLAEMDIKKREAKKSEYFTATRDDNGRIETPSIINKTEDEQIDKDVY